MTELIWDLQRFATAIEPTPDPATAITNLGIDPTEATAAATAFKATDADLSAGVTLDSGIVGKLDSAGAFTVELPNATTPVNMVLAAQGFTVDTTATANLVDGGSSEGIEDYQIPGTKRFDIDLSGSTVNNAVALYADNSAITGGSGDDAFQIYGDNAVISVTEGNNTAIVRGKNGQIEAGAGNDALTLYGSHGVLTDEGGNNSVKLNGDYSSVTLGDGNDTVNVTGGNNATVDAGSGSNVIIDGNAAGSTSYVISESSSTSIKGFTTGTAAASDVLVLGSADVAVGVTDNNLVIVGENSVVTVGDYKKSDDKIQWTTADSDVIYAAKVATGSAATFKYESDVDQYFGTGDVDKVSLTSSDAATSKVSIWMDGTNLFTGAKTANYVDIDVIDASKVAAGQNITIAGSESQNTILGGNGTGSVWGGFGTEDDVLTGGKKSALTFVAGNGEGNDVINSNSASDTVKFWNANVSDVASIDTSAGSVVEFNMTGGNTITVNTAKGFTVEAADGTKWNYSNGEFTQK